MSQPSRPALKPGDRKDSKVRFSRDELAPIRSDPSDFLPPTTRQSPNHNQQQQEQHQYQYQSQETGESEIYDSNSFPFSSEPVEITESTGDPAAHVQHGMTQNQGYYQVENDMVNQEEYDPPIHIQAYQNPQPQAQAQTQGGDGYTAPPSRVAGRRWSQAQHRPTLDTLLSAEEVYATPQISPRGSQTINGYQGQRQDSVAFNVPPQEAQPQLQTQPHPQPQGRPPSALRSSLSHAHVQAALPPGSPRRDFKLNDEYDIPGSPQRHGRASAPAIAYTPPRKMLDQQRYSIPTSQYAHASPRMMATLGASPDVFQSPNFRQYDRRLSPAPPYPSQEDEWHDRGRSDWDRDDRPDRDRDYRYRRDGRDSDETLYDEKKYTPSPRKDSQAYRRQRSLSDSSRYEKYDYHFDKNKGRDNISDMRRRTTREVEADNDDASSYHVQGGVFSQLLRLTGRTNTMRRRISSRGGGGGGTANTSSMGMGGGILPTMKSLGLKRLESTASTTFDLDDLDEDDPRVTGQKKKKNARRNSLSDLPFMRTGSGDPYGSRRKRKASIQLHVADILTRQQFVLKLAKALMKFGAPSHRIESQLSATALVLEIDAQFIHLPSIVIASFGDIDTRTSETHFVKIPSGGLELGKLHKVHNIYKGVVHDEMDAAEGTKKIHQLLKAPMEYKLWQRMMLAFLCSGLIAPVGFGGCLLDGLASGCLGTLLTFMQLSVASKNSMYSNIFEISIATIISFTARGLSTTGLFCYQAVASAGVVLILPGYTILCGSLELASKNIVSGSVRMVYAIIYSLFLGFGITIGSDLFYVLDRPAKRAAALAAAAAQSSTTIHGNFYPDFTGLGGLNNTMPLFNGTFTFSNATTDQVTSTLRQGSIICVRPPDWPWYRQGMPQVYLFLFVPIFSVLLSMWNMQPIRSRQLPVMCIISCAGFFTNTLGNHYIFDRSDVVSALGAFVIGLLGNIYSRVFGGTAFTSMVTGVLFLVPSGIAAAGGLAMTASPNHGDSYSQGLIIGFRMVQVAIGITVGLFGSGLLIYSFGRKKGAALFAF